MLFEEIINDVYKVVVMGCYVTRTVISWRVAVRVFPNASLFHMPT